MLRKLKKKKTSLLCDDESKPYEHSYIYNYNQQKLQKKNTKNTKNTELADTIQGGQSNLRDCSEKLQKGFAVCMNDRTDISDPLSKKRGVINLIVAAFRIYFKIGNYRSCKHMINPVERSIRNEPSIVDSPFIPKADLVTYRYYKGRLNVFEDK